MHGHFRSCDKDGRSIGHTRHTNLMAVSFIEPKSRAIEGIGILDIFGSCDYDLELMSFVYKLDLYCWMCKYELPASRL